MDALMTLGKVSLATALAAAAKIYGPSFKPQITLKALSYFDDGNLRFGRSNEASPGDRGARDRPGSSARHRTHRSGLWPRVVNAIPITPAMLEIARRVIWFEPPEKALADPVQFMAYALTYAVHEDMRIIRRYLSDADLREALALSPPGRSDPRSWAYWNSKMGRYPAPPMPVRRFGSADDLGVG